MHDQFGETERFIVDQHASERLWERYRIRFSEGVRFTIETLIHDGRAYKVLAKSKGYRETYLVKYQKRWLVVVWDSGIDMIITFLPEGAVPDFEEELRNAEEHERFFHEESKKRAAVARQESRLAAERKHIRRQLLRGLKWAADGPVKFNATTDTIIVTELKIGVMIEELLAWRQNGSVILPDDHPLREDQNRSNTMTAVSTKTKDPE